MATGAVTKSIQIGETEQAFRTPEELATIVVRFASNGSWTEKVRLQADQRWFERVHIEEDYDIWLISWLPGQSTGFHDHGASSGALVVASGILEEHRPGERPSIIYPNRPRVFGPGYAHDVRNASIAPAISVHAYSPPLNEMNEFELEGGELVPRSREFQEAQLVDHDWRSEKTTPSVASGASNIEEVLTAARARLQRLSPNEAYKAIKSGAIFVDIRPERQRAAEGKIPGALIVERNVLEWRFDPTSDARLPVAVDHDVRVIVVCSEGYTSSLAATSLQDLGLWRATDIIGGFRAWSAAGLPTVPPDANL
jgi:rhodanese-related sulfurtransferase